LTRRFGCRRLLGFRKPAAVISNNPLAARRQ
jgi:hypothetical protein